MEHENHFQNHFCLCFEGQKAIEELTIWNESVAEVDSLNLALCYITLLLTKRGAE